jgi:phage/plasmid primase-like uncharacterized protein
MQIKLRNPHRALTVPWGRDALRRYAGILGVLPSSLEALGAGVQCMKLVELVVPMWNGSGGLVGIAVRRPDDTKYFDRGSHHGLFYDRSTALPRGIVPVVEGASDVAAAHTYGVVAIGRACAFSRANVEQLATLFGSSPKSIPLIVAENDVKPDRRWPGGDAAEKMARELSSMLNRPVFWSIVPDENYKDPREWFNACPLDLSDTEALRATGQEFLERLVRDAIQIKPTVASSQRG